MRFYTNPFKRDAETVWQVSVSEPRFQGYSVLPEGVFADYEREITYSDGTKRWELFERRATDLFQAKEDPDTAYTQGKGYRVYYPGLIPMSRSQVARELRAALTANPPASPASTE